VGVAALPVGPPVPPPCESFQLWENSRACLLHHKCPQDSFEPAALTAPPANRNDTPERIAEVSPFFDYKELLWVNPGAGKDVDYWLQVYHSDVVVKKPVLQGYRPDAGLKQKIFQFSPGSRNRLLFVCRNSGRYIRSQFCCTYHESWPVNGKIVKNDLRKFIKRVERKFGRGSLFYLWILEFQERNAPHLHFFSSIEPTTENRFLLVQMWLEVIGEAENVKCRKFHDHKKNFFAWDMKNGAYLAKEYIGKLEQKKVPACFHNVGRFWGHSRNMKPDFHMVDLYDFPEALEDVYKKTVRIITKSTERKKDNWKAFGVLFAQKCALIDSDLEKVPGNIKKQISIGIKLSGQHKKNRLRSPTNLNKKSRSYSLPGTAPLFYSVLAHYTGPRPKTSGFSAFAKYLDLCSPGQKPTTPPAQAEKLPAVHSKQNGSQEWEKIKLIWTKKHENHTPNDLGVFEGAPSRGRRPEGPPGPPFGEAPRKAQPGRREYGLASGRKILSSQRILPGCRVHSSFKEQ